MELATIVFALIFECQHCQNEINQDAPSSLLDCKLVHLLHYVERDSDCDSSHPGECVCGDHMSQVPAMLDGLGCGFEAKLVNGRGHGE